MTGNTDPDDGWADLARELGLEQPARPPAPSAPVEADENGDAERDPLFPPADGRPEPFQEYEPDGEDGDDADAGGETTGEPGEEGPKKKRRRRRRRKKKGGEAGEVGTAAGGDADEEGDEADDAAGGSEDEDEETEEEEPAGRAPVDDGGPTAEASRELIANWDVPSWEQIVAGLYRPGGR